MAVYDISTISQLVKKLREMPKIADKAAANMINKAATFAVQETVKEITRQNSLSTTYVKSKIKQTGRARSTFLRAKVTATDRRTLMSRYPHSQSQDGVRVSIKRGSSKFLKGAKVINLRSGNGKGIAMRNPMYLRYLKTDTPKFSTLRQAKIAKALNNAVNRPRGWHVLHAASINQMFDEAKEEIQPKLSRFMTTEFFEQFRRLSK